MIDAVTAQAAPGGAMDFFNSLLIPTILIIGIMYFLMIRPQQKRMREHRDMIGAIRRGDNVVTAGGILGKVSKADEEELTLEVAEGVRIRVLRSTISEVRGKPEPASGGSKSGSKTPAKSEDKTS
ncbi:preprotein translocase subunit YajC [Methyloligella sp. 2.7D]|uniref:preprotein translocase subunit YajC n=1 Tax=unclassified Methyloligella TaxID=2625955 RepID=UPI00157D5EA4|nr:preprotein translocase subunit YajC [Methyloligella sp. GL2]QKP77726.1 preprotein translocase subunit YajC [Methyloligella sp. GL2]